MKKLTTLLSFIIFFCFYLGEPILMAKPLWVISNVDTMSPGTLRHCLSQAKPGDIIKFNGERLAKQNVNILTKLSKVKLDYPIPPTIIDDKEKEDKFVITIKDTLNINDSITIDGTIGGTEKDKTAPGVVIDGQGKRIFLVNTNRGPVELANLSLRNGKVTSVLDPYLKGGAIDAKGTSRLTIKNCNFWNDSAVSGSAVYSETPETIVQNCIFYKNNVPEGNALDDEGGALYIKGKFKGNGCAFDSNPRGALDVIGTAEISNCDFVNNKDLCSQEGPETKAANTGAGAILLDKLQNDQKNSDFDASIDKCLFFGNHADTGGAILIGGNYESLNITGTKFWVNLALKPRGGNVIHYSNPETKISYDKSTTFNGTNIPLPFLDITSAFDHKQL